MVKKKTVHEKVIREVIEKPAKRKKTKRKTAKKKSTSKKSSTNEKMEKALIENFISLQKVMVNFSSKFDNLSSQISKLLELFEISAKALAEKEFVTEKEKRDNSDVLEKMDNIIEQNKILARGMTLMHDRISEQEEIPFSQTPQVQSMPMPMPKPLPKMPSLPTPRMSMESEQSQKPFMKPLPSMEQNKQMKPLAQQSSQNSQDTYQKSISSNDDSKKLP